MTNTPGSLLPSVVNRQGYHLIARARISIDAIGIRCGLNNLLLLYFMVLLKLLLLLRRRALALFLLIGNSSSLGLHFSDFPQIKPHCPGSKGVGFRLPTMFLIGCSESTY